MVVAVVTFVVVVDDSVRGAAVVAPGVVASVRNDSAVDVVAVVVDPSVVASLVASVVSISVSGVD